MTVNVYKDKLKRQIKELEKFKPGTWVEFTETLHSYMPSIDVEKMEYNEKNVKSKYRAVAEDGQFATWGASQIIEGESIERLASSIAYYFHRYPFKLMVKDYGSKTWRSGTQYENKRFDKELNDAFRLDEMH